ncbi:MAG: hypothetical protein K2G55_02955, partial [Lachnospiraceae bacterium]|nr:hypothetical protein [Lachnospiraceae bacterium]
GAGKIAGDITAGAAELAANRRVEVLVGGTIAAFDKIVTAVNQGLQVFDALLSFFTGAFAGDWDNAAQGFRDSLNSIFPPSVADGLINAFNAALPAIKAVVSGLKAMFGGLIQDVKSIFGGITTIFKGIGTMFKGIFSGDIKTALKGFQMTAGGIVDTVGNIFKTKINAIKNFVVGAVSTFLPESVVNKIARAFDLVVGAWDVAINAAKGCIEGFVRSIEPLIGGIKTVLNGLAMFISGAFTGNWRQAWEGIKTIFQGVFESLVALCKTPINAVIGIINGAISGINKLGLTIPDWVPGIGGQSFKINVPTIPMLYRGTDNWKGGMAMIHDRGGEIVDLPQGSRVYPHDKSIEIARMEGARSGSGSVSINIQKLADKIEVRSEEDIDRIAEALAYKLKKIAFNT